MGFFCGYYVQSRSNECVEWTYICAARLMDCAILSLWHAIFLTSEKQEWVSSWTIIGENMQLEYTHANALNTLLEWRWRHPGFQSFPVLHKKPIESIILSGPFILLDWMRSHMEKETHLNPGRFLWVLWPLILVPKGVNFCRRNAYSETQQQLQRQRQSLG